MTTEERKQEIKKRIKQDDEFAIGCLIALYRCQTPDEQSTLTTRHENNAGFNALDTKILSSFAKFYIDREFLTPKQLHLLKRNILKYAEQLQHLNPNPLPIKKIEKKKQEKSVEPLPNTPFIKVKFPYDPKMINKIKTLTSHAKKRWNSEDKSWTVDWSVENLERLIQWGFDHNENLENLKNSIPKKVEPKKVKLDLPNSLFPFQKEGVEFIESRKGRALIADEMGLGKTIQALAWLNLHPELRPAIIICPASLKLNWERECKTWLNNKKPNVKIISGKNPNNGLRPCKDINIVNYDILKHWVPTLKQIVPKVVVTDEAHYYKNGKADRTQAVKDLCQNTPHIIALTGTPIVNRPNEMFNVLNLLDKNTFPSFFKYARRYCAAKQISVPYRRKDGKISPRLVWDFTGASHTEELHKIASESVMLRRQKTDVLKDLPPKTRTIVPIEITNAKEYRKAHNNFLEWLTEKEQTGLVQPGKVEKATAAEALVKTKYLEHLIIKGKIKESINWIKDFLESDEKLAVFSIHHQVVDTLTEEFKNISAKVDGRTPIEERQKEVDKFQNDPTIKLFIGGYENGQAAGVGWTLTAASNVCFLEYVWQPGYITQAEDRCHRIGQKDNVTIWNLVAANTFEESKLNSLAKKQKVLDSVLDGAHNGDINIFDDLLEALLIKK